MPGWCTEFGGWVEPDEICSIEGLCIVEECQFYKSYDEDDEDEAQNMGVMPEKKV
jgi:hypothetical protein